MRPWQGAVALTALLGAGCAGLPPKQPPAQLTAAVPLEGLEAPAGGE